jgi:hypothetical protein
MNFNGGTSAHPVHVTLCPVRMRESEESSGFVAALHQPMNRAPIAQATAIARKTGLKPEDLQRIPETQLWLYG